MKVIFIFSLLYLKCLFSNFSIINLENLENDDLLLIQKQIEDVDADFIIVNNQDNLNLDLLDLKNFNIITNASLPNYIFLSKIKIDHFQAYHINNRNFLIEAASENLPQIVYYGYFPSLNEEQIDNIRCTILNMDPYINKIMVGDFVLVDLFSKPLFELCKRELDVAGSADTKGNKSASAGITITSEDKSSSISVKGEYAEKENGDKEGKIEIKIKQEF